MEKKPIDWSFWFGVARLVVGCIISIIALAKGSQVVTEIAKHTQAVDKQTQVMQASPGFIGLPPANRPPIPPR